MKHAARRVLAKFALSKWLGVSWMGIAIVVFFAHAPVAVAQTPTLVRSTTWTEHYPGANRGLAYDGTYYYLGQIDGSRIDIFDESGFIRSIPKPAGANYLFPHGVAVDGQQKKIWATDYFGETIFEFDFTTGHVLRTIPFSNGTPTRLDYDTVTQTLWVTAYGTDHVYNIDMQGVLIRSFPIAGYSYNASVALDGSGNLLIADGQNQSGRPFRRYSPNGVLLEEIQGAFQQYDIATNVNDRGAGFQRPSTSTGDRNATFRIEHYSFGSAFESMGLPKVSVTYARGAVPVSDATAASASSAHRGYQRLHVCGSFALGAGSDGIDPLTEQVVLHISDWSGALLAGSFQPANGGYLFDGDVDGARVRALITLLDNGRYNYVMSLWRSLPVRFDNPLKLKIAVGDDYGETAATIFGKITKPDAPSVAAAE